MSTTHRQYHTDKTVLIPHDCPQDVVDHAIRQGAELYDKGDGYRYLANLSAELHEYIDEQWAIEAAGK